MSEAIRHNRLLHPSRVPSLHLGAAQLRSRADLCGKAYRDRASKDGFAEPMNFYPNDSLPPGTRFGPYQI
jgi:hypothetical protein